MLRRDHYMIPIGWVAYILYLLGQCRNKRLSVRCRTRTCDPLSEISVFCTRSPSQAVTEARK
jgi:hypothetical protein